MMAGKKLNQIMASVLINSIYAMKNYPVMLINTLLAPLSILVIIVFVSRGALIGVGIEGALIMAMISAGIGLQGDLSHLKNDFKLQDMVVSSPTSASTYMFGMGISELVYSIPVLLILSLLAFFYLPLTLFQIIILIAVLLLVFLFSIALGFFLSTLTTDVMQSWGFTGLISTLLSTIPPVYYLITYIPKPFQYIAYLSPTTYAAEILQSTTGYLSISYINLFLDWIVLIVITLVILIIAIKKSKWRED